MSLLSLCFLAVQASLSFANVVASSSVVPAMKALGSPLPWDIPSRRNGKDMMFPPAPGRGLASAEGMPRSLANGTSGMCVKSLIKLLAPKAMQDWEKCTLEKANATNAWQVAGTAFAISQQCWCDNNVKDALEEFGCCDHPDFSLYCRTSCKPDCSTPLAQQCVKDCPAVCLESDYAPEFCNSGCAPCVENLLCITEHSKNMTLAGHQDNPLICDDLGFDNSGQWDAFKKCYSEHPKRTHWHRHNAENYCYCQSGLKAAAETHKCCNAKWGKTLCDDQCADAKTNIDCSSVEAQQCTNNCSQTCGNIYTESMSAACHATCYHSGSTCARYSVCAPVAPIEFDYVCDDGSKPMSNGCCPSPRSTVGCPALCDSGTAHFPTHSMVGMTISHGLQCQCLGCPSSAQSANEKWKTTLQENLWKHGVATLASISKEVGILGANRKMQELMKARNNEILVAFDAHPTVPDEAFQTKVDVIVAKYEALIVAEAKRFKASGEKEDETSDPASGEGKGLGQRQGKGKGEGKAQGKGKGKSGNAFVAIVVGNAVGLLLLFACCATIYKVKVKGGGSAGTGNPGQAASFEGGPSVVMGRPVGHTLASAVQGAPVTVGVAMEGNEKGDEGEDGESSKV